MFSVITMGKLKANKKNNDTIMEKNELKSLILIIIIVSLIFLVFYGITLLTSKTATNGTNFEVQSETIQYDEILVGQVLNRNEKEYYVLLKNENNSYNDLYTYYLKSYTSKNNNKKYYTVDLNNELNSSYISDTETNVNTKKFFSSTFSDTTLLLIKNKKVNKVYDTDEEIVNILSKINS